MAKFTGNQIDFYSYEAKRLKKTEAKTNKKEIKRLVSHIKKEKDGKEKSGITLG